MTETAQDDSDTLTATDDDVKRVDQDTPHAELARMLTPAHSAATAAAISNAVVRVLCDYTGSGPTHRLSQRQPPRPRRRRRSVPARPANAEAPPRATAIDATDDSTPTILKGDA